MRQAIVAILVVVTLGIHASPLGSAKVKSVWLDASQCPDEKSTEEAVKVMAENGVNRIYVGAWKNGKTFYNSQTIFNAVGNDGIGRFIVPWTVKYAHALGIEVYAWFEYGYIASYSNISTPFGQYALKRGWLMGEVNHMYYMDPRSEATEFLAGIMIDSLAESVDGLQLDDHFSCRKKFVQCSPAVITEAARRLYGTIRKAHKTVPVSLAPAPLPESITEYSVNWPEIFYAGYLDEVVPLLYTSSAKQFENMVKTNEAYMKNELKAKTLMGIMVNKDSANEVTKWEDAKGMIELSNKKGYGVTIWYGKAVVQDYRKEFHDLWGK